MLNLWMSWENLCPNLSFTFENKWEISVKEDGNISNLTLVIEIFHSLKFQEFINDIVSPVLVKFLTWQQHHFCLFQLVPCVCVNWLWCQEGIFYCHPWKMGYTLLPEGTDIYTHSAAQSSKRFKPLSVTILLWQGHC